MDYKQVAKQYKVERARKHRIEQEKAQSREPYEQQREAIEAAKKAAFIASTLSGLASAAQRLTPLDILSGVENMDGLRYLYRGVCLYIYNKEE